jgi:23S rRNA pseudouridine1911/1915/1917 synthase
MSQSFQFHITTAEAGRRLDEFLASRFGSLSRIRIGNLIRAGACRINQSVMPLGCRLVAGDLIDVTLADAAPTAMEPEAIPLEVLYEDAHLIVVVKPAGMLVHPTMSVKRGTLANALAYYLNREFYGDAGSESVLAQDCMNVDGTTVQTVDPSEIRNESPRRRIVASPRLVSPAPGEAHTLIRPGLVHRLDRATSGLMVVAKTARALSQLSRHFNRRLIEKRYLALVTGCLTEAAGEVNAPIARDPERRPVWWVTPDGKQAVTRFTVRERFAATTLVELEPVTGRTNQLRIHLAYSGHAILGDELYGAVVSDQMAQDALRAARSVVSEQGRDEETIAEMISTTDAAIRPVPCPLSPVPCLRLCLHAWRLAFHHPEHNEWIEFTAPLPPDFAACVDNCR